MRPVVLAALVFALVGRMGTLASSSPDLRQEPLRDCESETRAIPPEKLLDFDLPAASVLLFAPAGRSFWVELKCGAPLDPSTGAPLTLARGEAVEVSFPGGFPFLGNRYTSIWVSSGGNVTLGTRDRASTTPDAFRHVGGPPRLSPLLADLAPSVQGAVYVDVQVDHLLVTWKDVLEHETTNKSTFQANLRVDGQIAFTYSEVEVDFAVVGVAEGEAKRPFSVLDFTGDLPGTFPAGAIFETFSRYGRDPAREELAALGSEDTGRPSGDHRSTTAATALATAGRREMSRRP